MTQQCSPGSEKLLPCPFCNCTVQFRKALHVSDGNVDSIIHAAPTDCPMVVFEDGSTDESILVRWNARAAAQSAWQPIETAPHETRVLLGWVYDGSWFCETGMASHGWRRGAYSTMSQHGQATHWMPLPYGPALSSAQCGDGK